MNHRNININKGFAGGGGIQSLFHNIISLSNLMLGWKNFKKYKGFKKDVLEFEYNLENNIFKLHQELTFKIYEPDPYQAFFVYDPKRRHIHKATVRDRVLHQAIFQILYPMFDKHFIHDSYSSRNEKGTHKGVQRLFIMLRKESKNWKKPVFALKCDVRKFFDSINHEILFELIKKEINDTNTLCLIEKILKSFEKTSNTGLPLGNVTSQLFANIYLNELDQFIKHKLKIKYYLRYADDFILINADRKLLEKSIIEIQSFIKIKLKLDLHPNKVSIRKLKQGIDFVGYVVLRDALVLRTNTKKRVYKKIKKLNVSLQKGEITDQKLNESMASHFGVLKHCKSNKIKREIKKMLYSR